MIYIVRHGKTDLNDLGIYGGRIDSHLNEEGIMEAKRIASKLKDIKFDVVISSPLKRAIETARIITKENIIIDDRIIERDNGELEGKYKKDVPEIDFNDPNEHRYDIENIIDFRNRINSFLTDVIKKYQDKNVLIVTHAGVGIYMRCFFEGEPKDNNYLSYKLNNCEVIKYEVKNERL